MTPSVRKCGDIVPGGEEEMTLVDALQEKARVAAQASEMLAEAKTARQTDGGHYTGLTPEQTIEWKAAERIKALEAENRRLREIEIAARTLLCCIDTGDYYNNIDTHVAKLRAALSSEPKQEQGE